MFNFIRGSGSLAAIIGIGIIFSTPGSASLTSFGQFLDFTNSFVVTNNLSSESLAVMSEPVTFLFNSVDGILPPDVSGSQDAIFTLSATTTTPAVTNGSTISEGGFSGDFSITRSVPTSGGFTNLLSGTFGPDPILGGTIGGSSPTFSVPDNTQVVFTSDFIAFSGPLMEALEFSLSGATHGLGFGTGNFLQSFTSSGVGTFAADPDPEVSPEPSSIVSMGAGLLGLAWFAARRQVARKAR